MAKGSLDHPNRLLVDFFLSGIPQGFHIGFIATELIEVCQAKFKLCSSAPRNDEKVLD